MALPSATASKATKKNKDAEDAAKAEQRKMFEHYRIFHFRTHGSEVRMWDAEQGAYGQFGVLTLSEAENLKALLDKQGATFVWLDHYDDCDGYDGQCKCRRVEHGKKLHEPTTPRDIVWAAYGEGLLPDAILTQHREECKKLGIVKPHQLSDFIKEEYEARKPK